jgi:hypothetical protein
LKKVARHGRRDRRARDSPPAHVARTASEIPSVKRRFAANAAVAWCIGIALSLGIGVCIVCWRTEWRLVGDWGFPLDDSWIHCQIARNFAQGHGWSFNPGTPVQNSSGPLWTALIALGFALAGPNIWVPKLMGAACYLACTLATGALAWTWSGWRSAGIIAMLAAVSSVPLAWHGLSAM